MNREPNQTIPSNTEITLKVHEPIKIDFDNTSTIPIILAVVGVISSMIAAIAKFGDDGIGKRLTVILTIAFSLLLIGSLVLRENQWGGIVLIASGLLTLIRGLFLAKMPTPRPNKKEVTTTLIEN